MSDMGFGDRPRYPGPPQEMENIILGPLVDDPDCEQDLQRQLRLLNTLGLSGVYLERLGPNGTGSIYQPDVIPLQLNDYIAIEKVQMARMEGGNGRLEPDQQPRPQQLQQPGASWHLLPPESNPPNTLATRQLPRYRQYQSPYPPRDARAHTVRPPYSFAMPPPPRPNALLRPDGSPQINFQRPDAPNPPRTDSRASSPSTPLIPQTPQRPSIQSSDAQALRSRSDLIARDPIIFLVPQTPQRPHIQRPEPQTPEAQTPEPTSFARHAPPHTDSQRMQAPQSGGASSGIAQDPGRWYSPQHERQRFLPPAPPAQISRQPYIPRHERAQPPAASPVRDNGTQRPPIILSRNQQPQPQVQGLQQGPRRGSFARP